MKLFIDPRQSLPYGTARALNALPHPIDYPHSVESGSDQAGWTYHYLGSPAGATRCVAELEAKGVVGVSSGLLFHVFDPNEPLALSEPDSRFLSLEEAIAMSAPTEAELALV